MDAPKLALGLSDLRRELEEILVLVSRTLTPESEPRPRQHFSSAQVETAPCSAAEFAASEPHDDYHSSEPDKLFEDTLVVITEFGQASPAILQMWLSIDYSRATEILSQFEAQGLVSHRGKVRHKAYELRRSRGMEFRL